MPNKNYIRGRRKEYKVMKELREEGNIISQRTAGSHSPIDVFAINKEKKLITFVQVKPNNFSEFNRNKIMKELSFLKGEWTVEFILR